VEARGLTLKPANVPAYVERAFGTMSLTHVFERV